MTKSNRRNFLKLTTATALTTVDPGVAGWFCASGALTCASTPGHAPAAGYKVLTPAQVAALEGIAEQIIPSDGDAGARDAGAVRYIDNVLATDQSEKLLLYAAGLEGTDQTSQLICGHNFAKLSFDQQTAVLKSIEQGTSQGEVWRSVSSAEFFAMVWRHVLEGFYGPPEHGGNRNYASWKMVGFPEHSGTM